MNVLLSTTRQWNCGDEFIMFGVQRLLAQMLPPPVNWVIYDRNPDLLGRPSFKTNAFKCETLEGYDLLVIAGTPEWWGAALKPLFRLMVEQRRRALFIGVGLGNYQVQLTEDDKSVLRNSPLIIARDHQARDELRRHGLLSVSVMTCPSLFAGEATRQRKEMRKVAVVNQATQTPCQKVGPELSKAVYRIYEELDRQGVAVDLIAHYIDEFHEATAAGYRVRYSYDARDYIAIYDEYDGVISTRLHGAMLSASLAIPTIMVNPDLRCTGAVSLLPPMVTCPASEAIQRLAALDATATSAALMEFRAKLEIAYLSSLRQATTQLR